MENKTIVFDMDGTIADLYGVKGWLNYLRNEDTTPYEKARLIIPNLPVKRYQFAFEEFT